MESITVTKNGTGKRRRGDTDDGAEDEVGRVVGAGAAGLPSLDCVISHQLLSKRYFKPLMGKVEAEEAVKTYVLPFVVYGDAASRTYVLAKMREGRSSGRKAVDHLPIRETSGKGIVVGSSSVEHPHIVEALAEAGCDMHAELMVHEVHKALKRLRDVGFTPSLLDRVAARCMFNEDFCKWILGLELKEGIVGVVEAELKG